MNSQVQKVMFSSKSVEWTTPQDLYDALDAEHGFTLDPCATHESAKCEKYYTPEIMEQLDTFAKEKFSYG